MWNLVVTHRIKIIIALFTIIVILVSLMLFWDESVMMRKGAFYHARIPEKVVALTFDDGPSEKWTPKILDELKKADIHATFFLVGKHVQQYPGIVKRVVSEGHEIGNHTMSHRLLIDMPMKDAIKEVTDGETEIERVTGIHTTLFRPPKAWISNQQKTALHKLGYTVVLWRINTKDWVNFDDKLIVHYVEKKIKPGDIILFHDAGGAIKSEGGNRQETVDTIAPLAAGLRKKGYRFATISELLALQKKYAQ
ncbi:MAG: polysaccharide deacetylase family protein [Candidatus Omnitrophica bacterium]|nr:polysaccharide deacetylase family protein [Candidatus Omnitrophota bacterium]